MNDNLFISILFFYTRLNGHMIGVLKSLSYISYSIQIDVVYWDNDRDKGFMYDIPSELLSRIRFHKRISFNKEDLYYFLCERQPEIIYSGWNDSGYVYALRRYRSSSTISKIICGIDDQWKGTFRQYIGMFYFRMFYKRIFDYMWVSGKPQYYYAQRFGYTNQHIINNLLSADTEIFNRRASFTRRFIFVGRYTHEKGADLLIDSYLALPEYVKKSWPLVMIGDGIMKSYLLKRCGSQVQFLPFLQPEDLVKELLKGGVACVPSNREKWGVVIHEYAVLGIPIIASSTCGAVSEFLIPGYNGYMFRNLDSRSLTNVMLKITQMTYSELQLFSNNSALLGLRINSDLSARSLLSVQYISKM